MTPNSHKASALFAFFLVALLLSCSLSVSAQSQSQYDRGTPPQHAVGVSSLGSYVSTELGTVNLSNGSLNFKIPLGTVGGRGGLSIPLTLNYSSKVWSASTDTDTERESGTQQKVAYGDYDRGLIEGGSLYDIIGAGWTIAGWPSLESKRVLIGKILSGPNVGCYSYTLTKLTLYLPDRGEIEFRDDATNGAPLPSICTAPASRGTRWHATDGSGTIFINDVDNGVAQWPSSNLSGVVITADGTRLRFGSGGGMTDRNGNKITPGTDQLGRTITGAQNVPDPDDPSVTLAYLLTIPGYQGDNRYYKIKKGIMNQNYRSGINPTLPVITGDWDPEGWGYDWWGNPTRLFLKSYGLYAQRIDDLEVLTELVLPDGRSLKFKYNQFGEVAEVELPTGGKIQYDYLYRSSLPTGNSPTWETGTNGAGSGIVTDVKWVDRAVTQKRTYPDGVTLEGTWSYGFSSSNASVLVTSASGTLLSDTQHYFLPASRYTEYPYVPGYHDGTHYSLWSTGIEWRTETRDASGAVIAASEQDWTQRAPVSWSGYAPEQPASDNRVNQQRKFLDNGMMARVDTLYDQFNNATEVKEYDFDQSLKRRAVTSYSATNLVNGVDYADDSIHLLGLPLQQSVYDGVGEEQARTVYEYDVYTGDGNHDYLLSYPSITGHDTANYGAGHTTRGNVTRIGNWIKSSNSYLYAYPRYDIAGSVVSMKDARGYVFTVSFTDDFGNGSNPGTGSQGTYGATYAFPTLITSAPPNPGEQPHTARSQYDFSTGLLTGFKDRNGIVRQTIYNDPFNRPTLVKAALGISGVENHAAMYYAPATVFGVTLAKNDVLTAADHSALDDGNLRSWAVTDGFGRTMESWSEDPQGDVKGVASYDALGRAIQTSNPFRPSLGEAPVYTTTGYDFAGRIVSVRTPDNAVVSTSYSGNTVTVTDQDNKKRKSVTDALGRIKEVYEDPNSLNYLTSYSYDVLDNLTTVLQGSQTRTFVYDSLKRLTSATNPEVCDQYGTPIPIVYAYDNNGNLTQKTDARGVVSGYVYDALNRNTTIDYSNTTTINPDVTRLYDGAINGKGRFWYSYAGGNLTVGANVEHTAIDNYDALGRPSVQRQLFKANGTWSAQTYETRRSYNLAGGVTLQTYPSGHTVSYAYDAAGRTNSFTGNLGDGTQRTYATGITYASGGQMKQEQFGTTTPVYNKLSYNSRQQLSEIRASTTGNDDSWNRGKILNQYSLQCSGAGCNATDNNGNLRKQEVYIPNIEPNTGSTSWHQQYDYDSLNRLERAHEYTGNTELDWQQEYVYDRWGNRTLHQTNTWGSGINKKEFIVNPVNNRLAVPGGQAGAMTYDNAGNLTTDTYSGSGVTRTYDAENRMTSETQAENYVAGSYTYNADGQRVRRKVGSLETWQVYGFDGELLGEYAAGGAATAPQKEYGYRNGQLLITAEAPVPAVNVALAANGATVTASSAYSGWAASSTINGDRKGLNGGQNGGWVTAQAGFPAWLQVDFNGSKTISEIDVFTLQDNWQTPSEPTEAMTFTTLGLTGYDVQYWSGSAWVTVTGGNITGNNKVWRKFTFAAIATTKIRVLTNASADGYSRLAEVEAWTGTAPPSPPARTNFGLAANGAVATASSAYSGWAASGTINGDRKGLNGGQNGVWVSAQTGFPAWLQVDFNGSKTIDEVDVFTLQNNWSNPSEPTEAMTFSLYGLTGYEVQYWNGTGWVTVTGGSVTGNNKVWRKFTFSPITTTKIRVLTNASIDGYSRLTEVEAWSPAEGATNLALGKPATQISDHHPVTTANRAVDGNTNGNQWENGYTAGTNSHLNPWWQVDLQSVQSIGAIEVWGRTDCCPEMTSNYYVFVSDNPFTSYDLNTTLNQAGVSNYYVVGYSGTPGTLNVNRTGRYVRVQLAGTNYLVLGEVKVLSPASGGGSSTGASLQWLVADHLGTPRMVFDQTGSLATMKRHDYLPFGEELFAGQGARSMAQGYVANNVRQKFTSKERDSETGLDYFLARYYGSTQGRFTSADPLMASARSRSPQTWNRYSYCYNNPLRFLDPDGMDVQFLSDQATEYVLYTLPEEIRKKVRSAIRKNGVIRKGALNKIESKDQNFKDLKELVDSKKTTEVTTGTGFQNPGEARQDFYYKTSDESKKDFVEGYVRLGNSRQDAEQIASAIEFIPEGTFGVTQTPAESPSGNARVTISDGTGAAANMPLEQKVGTTGHELFVHALLLQRGKPFGHDVEGGPTDSQFIEAHRRSVGNFKGQQKQNTPSGVKPKN